MPATLFCFSCGKSLNFQDRVGIRETCLHCGADVHACKNCQHYDPKVYQECLEPVADRVREKDRANYCDHFTPGKKGIQNGLSQQDLLNQAEALFRKK
ncbi:MAG: hypothetical protein K1X29_06290 [Bdellovibrionales bacterium]|nr:hypothetical protein [Bdellovibrionales bacterium]